MGETISTEDQQSDIEEEISDAPSSNDAIDCKAKQERKERTTPSDKKGPKPWPVDHHKCPTGHNFVWGGTLVNWYHVCFYSYMNPIFKKGMNQFKSGEHLDLDDLFSVPSDMSSAKLVQKFHKLHQADRSLTYTLWRLTQPYFTPAAFSELIYITSRVAMPLCLRRLLQALEENPESAIIQEGLGFAVAISAASFLGAIAQNRTIFLSTQSGILLRASLTNAIYEHSLRLSPEGREGITAGEITNLVAVDTQKIYDVMIEGQNLWSCPVLIVVVTTLLWVLIGPELVTGVVLLILFLPVVKVFVTKMLRLRKERSKLTDVRINILSSMLQGIRVTKLNHYEDKVEENVMSVRNGEMKLLRQELHMWGWVMTSAICSPLIASTFAFSFYALWGEGNIITPADAFSALLFFAILRFPINMAARLVGKLGQALEGVRRIEEFLSRETRPDHCIISKKLDKMDDRTVVNIQGGCFSIHPDDFGLSRHASNELTSQADFESARNDPVFSLKNISLSLKKSEIVAIAGRIGSGKTTLLRSILGEVPAQPGSTFWVAESLSYAPQIPFILNKSLRENILFGCEFDEARYDSVLAACCLHDDVRRLGPAGDLTQIGERGVTLSGKIKSTLQCLFVRLIL
jgi:ABC-type multidrug transport system fused ATPase/permease subunit